MTDLATTYISTTIPYVNAAPHVGFALELVQTDALARFARLAGERVITSTGTDDHSLKNVRAAEAAGEPVRALIERQATAFVSLADALDAPFDARICTSRDARHAASVARLFRACASRGDLYRRRYRGLYCVGCERFYAPDELERGLCSEHARAPEPVEEENWFFRLSRHGAALLEAIERGRLRIVPEERRNEVIAFVRAGLEDFSVSRSSERARGFGVPVPGDAAQVVYVWFDALANYLTVFDYGALGERCGWQSAGRRVHVLGKGVLRFHAVYWPAILLAAGLELPTELRVHGHLTVDGKKIGKSLGNGVDPAALIDAHGATALRHYLLRHIPAFKDADFSAQRLREAHDSELADELGNLVRRVLVLAHRHTNGRLPLIGELGNDESALEAAVLALPGRLDAAFAGHELGAGYDAVWELVRATNRYLERAAPWQLARSAGCDPLAAQRLATVLGSALAALRALAPSLAPFVPKLASELAACVGARLEPGCLRAFAPFRASPSGEPLALPPLLAPRLVARR